MEVLPEDRLGFIAEGQVPIASTYLGRERSTSINRYTFSRRLKDESDASIGARFKFDTTEPCLFSYGATILEGRHCCSREFDAEHHNT